MYRKCFGETSWAITSHGRTNLFACKNYLNSNFKLIHGGTLYDIVKNDSGFFKFYFIIVSF